MRLLFSKPKYIVFAGVMAFIMAVMASGWASTYQRLEDMRELNREQREIIQEQIKSNRQKDAMNQVALTGALAAWRFQQGVAGEYESMWQDRVKKLSKARNYISYLRGQLKQCDATNTMITDDGWTGNTYIKPGSER